jgi:hypothetical protein
MATLIEKRQEIENYINLRLGGQMVDVELDKEHYDLAINNALIRFRQRADNSQEESYSFLSLVKEQQEYILPSEVQEVRQVFRRGIGSVTGTTASQFEPFASGYLNTYMLVAGRVGGLLNYELFTQYQELAMKMFGGFINFTFDRSTKKLTIVRKIPQDGEDVLLWTYNYKPDVTMLNDHMIFPWVQNYALAMSKHMLGEAREKFAQIAGPQGGTSLNGASLKGEANAEMERLEAEIQNYYTGNTPMWWVTG